MLTKLKENKILILIVAIAIIVSIIQLFFKPTPVMIVDAKTRHIEYTVLNKDAGRVLFKMPVMLKRSIKSTHQCVEGMFEPYNLSNISYSLNKNSLVIRAKNEDDKVGKFYTPTETIELSDESSVVYGPESPCYLGKIEPIRLPIWGITTIGTIQKSLTRSKNVDPFSGLLISGQVNLFGKQLSTNTLYPAGTFELPTGSKLSSSFPNNISEANSWWGFATYSEQSYLGHSISFMNLSASSETSSLKLNRLGSRKKNEEIQVGFLTQLSQDPLFLNISLILAVLFFAGEFITVFKNLITQKKIQ